MSHHCHSDIAKFAVPLVFKYRGFDYPYSPDISMFFHAECYLNGELDHQDPLLKYPLPELFSFGGWKYIKYESNAKNFSDNWEDIISDVWCKNSYQVALVNESPYSNVEESDEDEMLMDDLEKEMFPNEN